MKDVVGFAALVLFMVFLGLIVSLVDSCQAYQDCMKKHSMKTCKAHFGKDDELDDDDY